MPAYKLDHLIRERYPTFVDALQELDDVLCLVFLFASLSPSTYVPAARVEVSGGKYVVEAMDGAMTLSTREGVRQPGLWAMTLLR